MKQAFLQRYFMNLEIKSIYNNLCAQFEILFNDVIDSKLFFAPGRVNLIGEHTDYNGGHVFPCALNIGTYGLVKPRSDNKCRFYSINFAELGIIEFSLDNLLYDKNHNWANYPKGVIKEFLDRNVNIPHGFDIIFFGNIPNGAGLSSSASIEVLTGTILNKYVQDKDKFTAIQIALIGQAAENNYIGVGCGIMDQFASAMGKANNAILLDCNTLKYQYAPLELDDYKIVIINSNKRRGLADSKYNERLAECREALKIAQTVFQINSLGELSEAQIDSIEQLFTNKIIYKRAKHAVYENQRALNAVYALQNNDLYAFGKFMAESHMSLKNDYEVTGNELDSLVNAASEQDGCIGARMTGAGFGGCTVNIVKADKIEEFVNKVDNIYKMETGLTADFYTVTSGNGAHEIFIEV